MFLDACVFGQTTQVTMLAQLLGHGLTGLSLGSIVGSIVALQLGSIVASWLGSIVGVIVGSWLNRRVP